MHPQLPSPLSDKVNCPVLRYSNRVVAFRVPDHIQYRLDVVNPKLLLGGILVALLLIQVFLEFIDATPSPLATRVWTVNPTRKMD
jgi:hypothetical protein